MAASTSGAEQAAAPGPLTQYNNTAQKYQLLVPASWESKGKAGACVCVCLCMSVG